MTISNNIKVYYTKTLQSDKEYAATTDNLIVSTQNNLSLLITDSNLATSNNRLMPAPMVSITPEIYYANDTPIGYTYNINLNGYATSITNGILPNGTDGYFQATLSAMKKIEDIFSDNNGIFLITDSGNVPILKANGCIVRGLNFDQNDNNWINYAKYNVVLEANELEMGGCSGILEKFGCLNGLNIPSGIKDSDSPLLLDMTKYRVKSFNDGWTFNIDNSNAQNYSFNNFQFNNDFIEVQYNISAVGKHYPNYEPEGQENNIHLRPAWQLAKSFCQDRLYTVVSRLVENVLKSPDQNTLQNLFDNANGSGLLCNTNTGITNSIFNVYNEEINCSASEAEGSFSATYKCIIKRKNTGADTNHSIHTFKVTRDITDDGEAREKTITVQGNIQGLMRGGLFNNGTNKITSMLELPQYGRLLSYTSPSIKHSSGANTKYKEALASYNTIADNDGLKSSFKEDLEITISALIPGSTCNDSPYAASHEVTHNYNTGSIDYTTIYTTSKACTQNSKVTNIKCSIEEPAPKIIQFVVPGKQEGPVVQIFGNYTTPRTITITAEGYDKSITCDSKFSTPTGLLTNIGGTIVLPTSILDPPPPEGTLRYNLIENNINYNRKDGSFSQRKKYTITNK